MTAAADAGRPEPDPAKPISGAVLEEKLAERLVARGAVEPSALARARHLAARDGEHLWHIAPRLGLVAEEAMTSLLGEIAALEVVGENDMPKSALALPVSPRFLKEYGLVPLSESDTEIIVAASDPQREFALKALTQAVGKRVRLKLAPPRAIEQALSSIDQLAATSNSNSPAGATNGATYDEHAELLDDQVSASPGVRAVNALIQRAVEMGASDIHLEPFENGLSVRYRLDGVLQKAEAPPADLVSAVLSRIKLLARMNIAERRLPQDGRIRVPVRGRPIDLRVSTLPSLHGESLVLRILDRSNVTLDLETLGFKAEARQTLDRFIGSPNGIILVTGPTGSGKTTTLYAMLSRLDRAKQKIITIEDPVEYHLAGVVQTPVQSGIGLDFARVLRSALRQDPDVILVGEIRDAETARIAVQAALTGHLVLSTVHTNSAPATITRLMDMGSPGFLIAATLKGVVAQRLVRRLCERCKHRSETALCDLQLADGLSSTFPAGLRHYEARGCEVCAGTGYSGRMAIYEILPASSAIAGLISRSATEKEITDAAVADGMKGLLFCGLEKAAAGETSLEEVLRVTMEG